MYAELENTWPDEFKKWFETSSGHLQNLREIICQCMLKPVRTAAGLGDPANKWSNQRTESMNSMLKEANENQISYQVSIHKVIETRVVKQQESEMSKQYTTPENIV